MKKTVAVVSLVLMTSTAGADAYKWKDSEGRIHYSDRPVEGAELVKSIPLTTYKSPPIAARPTEGSNQADTDPVNYASFAFVSPANDTTVRDNAGNIAIQLSVDPPLRQGHSIALTIDGTPAEKTVQATTFTLSDVNRGTHTLQAAIVDSEGNTLIETQTTTVHMQRISILSPNNPNNPNNKK